MVFLLAQAMEKLAGCQKMAALGSHLFLVKKMVSQQNTWYGGVTFSFILILHHFLTFFHFSHMPLTSIFTDFFLLKGFFQESFW